MEIDAVVMWVDGNDQEWIKEKEKYSEKKADDSNSSNRFRDWGLMKYWFRCIESYMPWIRMIHFVTWGHTPDFLRLDHPKLNIVNHQEIMPESALPSFNASAIEMNIHKIPGLAKHFVFFNDDMFVTHPLSVKYFFKNNKPCQYYAEIPVSFSGPPLKFQMLLVQDLRVLNNHFNKRESFKKFKKKYLSPKYALHDNLRSEILHRLVPDSFLGFRNFHVPVPFLKSTFVDIWKKEPLLLMETTSHRFRDDADVNQWLALWWQLASGNFTPQKVNCRNFSTTESNVDEVCKAIMNREYEMICINDTGLENDYEVLAAKIAKAFESVVPQKSSFEK